MLLQQLVLHQLDGVDLDLMRIEVEQGYAEFGRCGNGDVPCLGSTRGNELRDETRSALFRRLQRSEHGGFFDHAILYQALRQAAETRSISAEG
jgi:hypothetical protein